jgi:hypothetical protein
MMLTPTTTTTTSATRIPETRTRDFAPLLSLRRRRRSDDNTRSRSSLFALNSTNPKIGNDDDGLRIRITVSGTRRARRILASSSSSSSSAFNDDGEKKSNEELLSYVQSLKKQPWDQPPKPWKEFWGMRAAGVVLNVDNEKQTVDANEIESPSLNFPQTREEGLERLKSNLVYYRQNYLVMFVPFCLMFGGFNFWPLALSAVGFFAALASASDKILGEVQLKMQEKNMDLAFNKQRVLGMDRKVLMRAGVLFGLFWMTKWVRAYDAVAAASKITRMLIRVVIMWMMTSAYLAILRPIDLKSTLTNAWGELKDAKSKEDFEKAGKKAWSGVKSWFNQKAREQPQATPIIVNVKGENMNTGSAQNTTNGKNNNNNNNSKKGDNDWKKGAMDADARDASKKGLPPGSAR